MENVKNISSLRHRVFNVIFLVGIFMSFSCSLMNYILGLEKEVILISFACGLITIGLYLAYLISKNYELLSLIVVILLSFLFFPPCGLLPEGLVAVFPFI